ncbi:trigger factor [Buchnera aphidicola]|uniref:trigger factor n=1 Tax=Buchnera aphidicola TaxID=9 RepID=UPI002542B28B|nr:trigger factor [Buchnera aphidicola]WII23586.1 trigger factor [Buchnera aphidicola (Sipha maydis)]
MNTTLIKKKIEIKNTIPSKKIEKKIRKKLSILKKTVFINGFRQGKTPNKIIETNFRNDVLNNVLKKILKKRFKKIIKQKKIKKYSNVKYFFEKYEKGNDFNYTLKFDVISNKLIKKLKLIKIYKPKIKIKKSDVKTTILNLQRNIVPWTTSNKLIKKNDKINIKYKILSINKKIILQKKNFSMFINKNFLCKKIYKNILKKAKNEQFKIKYKFCKYHPEKKISGKTVILNITINKIKEKKIKDINFKIIKNFGIQEQNLKALKKNIYKILKKERKKISQEYLKKQFIKKWIKLYTKKIPKKQIKEEIQKIYKENLLDYKNDKNIFKKKYQEDLKKKCHNKLTIQILFNKIISTESLSISQKLIKKIFQETKKNLPKNGFSKKKKIYKKNILNNIKNYLLIEKTFNFIFKNVSLKEKKIKFKKILKQIKNNYQI